MLETDVRWTLSCVHNFPWVDAPLIDMHRLHNTTHGRALTFKKGLDEKWRKKYTLEKFDNVIFVFGKYAWFIRYFYRVVNYSLFINTPIYLYIFDNNNYALLLDIVNYKSGRWKCNGTWNTLIAFVQVSLISLSFSLFNKICGKLWFSIVNREK